MEVFMSVEGLIALLTLASLEIVLGIDNIVFVTVVTNKLPVERRPLARKLGIGLAMFMRIGLLFALAAIMGLSEPLLTVLGRSISGRDIVLIVGGLFLLGKATHEIHEKMDEATGDVARAGAVSFAGALAQIVALDIVFSLDSVITAVGMTSHLPIMIAAVVIAVCVMVLFADPIGDFVSKHQTIQMLAFSFLILVGVLLVAEGLGQHIDRGYVYFAMGFSLFVEFLNMRIKSKSN